MELKQAPIIKAAFVSPPTRGLSPGSIVSWSWLDWQRFRGSVPLTALLNCCRPRFHLPWQALRPGLTCTDSIHVHHRLALRQEVVMNARKDGFNGKARCSWSCGGSRGSGFELPRPAPQHKAAECSVLGKYIYLSGSNKYSINII